MIQSFADKETEDFFFKRKQPRSGWRSVIDVAARKLDMVDAAIRLNDLKSPPGNKLHPLVGERAGQHAIWVSDKWRVCFTWTNAGPIDVEITDYH